MCTGNLLATLPSWGLEFKVEFDLTVTSWPTNYCQVFQFTKGGLNKSYGDRIPAMWAGFSNKTGTVYFRICSDVDGQLLWRDCFRLNADSNNGRKFKLGQKYHFVIQQTQGEDSKYHFEIFLDGKRRYSRSNVNAKNFDSVKLYASHPKTRPFRFGRLENFKWTNEL